MKLTTQYKRIKNIFFSTIRRKVLISYFVLIFAPLIILTAVTYIRVSANYEKQIKYAATQAFDQANQFIYYKVNALIKASDILYFNSSVQTILTQNKDEFEQDIIQQNKDMLYLDNFLFSLKNEEDVYRVKLYVPDWFYYSVQDINFDKLSNIEKSEIFQSLQNHKSKVLWMPPQTIVKDDQYTHTVPVVSMIRKISNQDLLTQYIGIMEVFILQSKINDIIAKANITNSGVVYIANSHHELIASSDEEKIDVLNVLKVVEPNVGDNVHDWETIAINDNRFIYRYGTIENTDWHLVAMIPYKEIIEQSQQVRNLMLILFIVIGAIAYGVAYLISKAFTERIALLSSSMVKVQEGELQVQVDDQEEDEIGQLSKSFNYMIERINVLVENQFKYGKEIKNAELKALQAQINPHFLYNTLDLINWKALDKDVPEIAEISRVLAKFYKLSLNKGQDVVSVKDELDHVKQYIIIQNMRFENRIHYEIKADDSLLLYEIPKIVLQPIVENSIMHGILKKTGQEGHIVIEGRIEADQLILVIADNGIGIEPEKLKTILFAFGTKESHGYGIKNIHERLQLCYGKEYGLHYESMASQGTRVTITIPARLKE